MLASVCASPLSKILSGLVYKPLAGDSCVISISATSEKSAISAQQCSKAAGIVQTKSMWVWSQTDVEMGICTIKRENLN